MSLYHEEDMIDLKKKVPFIVMGIMGLIIVLAARLFYFQVMQGDYYKSLATEIFVREEEIVARRGNITDRHGKIIAVTRPYFEIVMIPQYISDRDRVVKNLCRVLALEESAVLKKLDEARYEPRFMPVVIAADVDYERVAKIKEYLSPDYTEGGSLDFSGVAVRHIPVRKYLYPEVFAHALGYLTEIDKTSFKQAKLSHPDLFSLGDLTGAAGVEKAYDLWLKGKDGVLGRVVNARGREVEATEDLKVLKQQATEMPRRGNILKTTLDFNAQMTAHTLFEGKKGAVVAIDPRNGEVLVLYSSPGYDPNRITKNIDRDYWRKINLDEEKFLFNRAIQAMYPPASTYKIVGMAAGVDLGLIDTEKTFFSCGGGLKFGNRFFKCWKGGGHGRVDPLKGLAQSCDVFFYRLGLKLGVDRLAQYARLFGFASKTGIEIPYEQAGLIPTSEWKEKRFKQKWFESETLSVAIGQSYDLTTPLQNAVAASLVANGGYRVTPHLGLEILSPDGELVEKIKTEKTRTQLSGSAALAFVKKGMIEVVHGVGTATKLKNNPHKIAGKTGTAQVVSHGSKGIKGQSREAHALFIAFAPYDDPQIAVAVIVEHGRGGSATAAPIAGAVIDAYFDQKLKAAKQVTNLTVTRLNASILRDMHPRSVDFEIPIH
ncbi:MAG: penicillin-binding protein 2 [Deltaproteobacteria bacterium]|nr:penicillin-binding protein 2 [Deltaproteobacteria bacterium]